MAPTPRPWSRSISTTSAPTSTAANCHKWLLAPTGSGFLYLGQGNEDRLQPLQVSWGWRPDRSQLDERDEFGSTPRIRCYEFEGTRDICPWLAVPAAIDFQQRPRLRRHPQPQRRSGATRARALRRHRRLEPARRRRIRDLHGFLTAFRLPHERARARCGGKRCGNAIASRRRSSTGRRACCSACRRISTTRKRRSTSSHRRPTHWSGMSFRNVRFFFSR